MGPPFPFITVYWLVRFICESSLDAILRQHIPICPRSLSSKSDHLTVVTWESLVYCCLLTLSHLWDNHFWRGTERAGDGAEFEVHCPCRVRESLQLVPSGLPNRESKFTFNGSLTNSRARSSELLRRVKFHFRLLESAWARNITQFNNLHIQLHFRFFSFCFTKFKRPLWDNDYFAGWSTCISISKKDENILSLFQK